MLRILTDGKLTNSAYECGILAAKAIIVVARSVIRGYLGYVRAIQKFGERAEVIEGLQFTGQ